MKPEKKKEVELMCFPDMRANLINTGVKSWNEAYEKWEEYHEQEIKRVKLETWKTAHEQYKFDDVMNKELFISKDKLPTRDELREIVNDVLLNHKGDDIASRIDKRIRGKI